MKQKSTSNRNMKIIKMASITLAGQVLLYVVALVSVININVTTNFWRLSNSSFVIGLLLIVSLLMFGLFSRMALYIHLIYVAVPITWVIPFLAAGFEHRVYSVFLFSFVVIMSLLNIYFSYTITLQTLNKKEKPAVQSGRLDMSTGFWDLEKHLYNEDNKSIKESLARYLLPLGSILGVLLSRNFPNQSSLVSILISIVIIIIVVSGSGIHLAAAMFVKSIQKEHKIKIYV